MCQINGKQVTSALSGRAAVADIQIDESSAASWDLCEHKDKTEMKVMAEAVELQVE